LEKKQVSVPSIRNSQAESVVEAALIEHGLDGSCAKLFVEKIATAAWEKVKNDCYFKKKEYGMPCTVEYLCNQRKIYIHLGKRGLLGEGQTARVTKSIDFVTGQILAHKRSWGGDRTEELLSEATLCQELKECQHVVQVVQIAQKGILYEYMDGGSITNLPEATPEVVHSIALQVIEGIKELHTHGVIHRDIRPENILYKYTPDGKTLCVKIGDLGVATKTGENNGQWLIFSSLISLEKLQLVLAGKCQPSLRDDLFALGITLYQLVYKDIPAFCHSIARIFRDATAEEQIIPTRGDMDSLVQLVSEFHMNEQQSPSLGPLVRDLLTGKIQSVQEVVL
jgi:serine/threonine protein kinase